MKAGTFTKLNEKLWPGCFLARSSPNDVARVEDRTFICSLSKDTAGPTNNWEDPFVMRKKLKQLFQRLRCADARCMCCRFRWARSGSPMSQIGVQLTDSAYAVVNMRIMARIGAPVFAEIDKDEKRVVPCMHYGGRAAGAGREGCSVACNDDEVHCAFSGDARDLELWVGLWRQRAAGQEVLCAAHRLQHRAR